MKPDQAPRVEAWMAMDGEWGASRQWGWQCLDCGDESAPAWDDPDAAIEQGDLHECGTPLAEVRP